MSGKIKNWLPVIILLALSLILAWPLSLPGYFSHQDDLQVMRVFEMRKCLMDLQIPCRWVPDMGFGNGFPLFNYYGVLPYYLGALISFLTGFVWASKILFFIPIFFGGLGMYFLAKIWFGKMGGFLAGILYTFAPYKALDIYVRGAISESFALIFIPFVFYFMIKLSLNNSLINFLGLSLFLCFFLLSHNLMTLIFTPFIIFTFFYIIFIQKTKNSFFMLISTILGFGLSAFYIIPAFFEKNLIHSENLTRFGLDFRANFVSLDKMFLDRDWGYGLSGDTISTQIGWPHWCLVGIILVLILFSIFSKNLKNRLKKYYSLLVFLIFVFLGSVFMMHIRSSFIWEEIGMLAYLQFPWRFLSITIFSASILGGVLTFILWDRWRYIITGIIVGLTILLNFNFFAPEHFYPDINDLNKLSGKEFKKQSSAIIMDYLPKTVWVEPRDEAPILPIIKSGSADIISFEKKSNNFKLKAKINENTVLEFPIFDFPNWKVYINGGLIPHENNNYYGRIIINLDPGYYEIIGRFEDTPLRFWSNALSLISLLILIFLAFWGFKKKWWQK